MYPDFTLLYGTVCCVSSVCSVLIVILCLSEECFFSKSRLDSDDVNP